jgi:hypothetical protein
VKKASTTSTTSTIFKKKVIKGIVDWKYVEDVEVVVPQQ